ncbi:hypothetical protein ADL22_06820 [Streptomyces sp. NRRL F-4489]|uniref:hypothetical protein n=1 Tax=Streptomyces sp. NRRL F-4489 TaxID=1609095 RepID=UPI00074B030F|nr:hypothetical protein [Streptomyces sp. NRRL F-4489]KUL51045.1 hypothetical protein ADL22_06820 [Streptomyces sp. NRRL F-4489]
MNHRYLRHGLVAGLVGAVILVLGMASGWPVWVWVLLPTLMSGGVLVVMFWPKRGENYVFREPDENGVGYSVPNPPMEPPYLEVPVSGIPVPSALADYPFLFSATVRWRHTAGFTSGPHGNPSSAAVASILRRVQDSAAAEHPSRYAFVQYALEGALGVPRPDDSGSVTAFATHVRLALKPADEQHLEELDALRKAAGAWESQSRHERDRRAYLGDDVLKSPGSAVVWWLARHENDIERAVEMIGPLACLSAAANDQEVPEAFRHLCEPPGAPVEDEPLGGFAHPDPAEESGERSMPADQAANERHHRRATPGEHISGLLDELGFVPGSDERAAFVHRLARMSEAAGRPEAADSILRDLRSEDLGSDAHAAPEPPDQAPADAADPADHVASGPTPPAAPGEDTAPGTPPPGADKEGTGERSRADWWQPPTQRDPGSAPGTQANPGSVPDPGPFG